MPPVYTFIPLGIPAVTRAGCAKFLGCIDLGVRLGMGPERKGRLLPLYNRQQLHPLLGFSVEESKFWKASGVGWMEEETET